MRNVIESGTPTRRYSLPDRDDVVKLQTARSSVKVELPDGRVLTITGTGRVFSEATGEEIF